MQCTNAFKSIKPAHRKTNMVSEVVKGRHDVKHVTWINTITRDNNIPSVFVIGLLPADKELKLL